MKVKLYTLGCKVNQYETQEITEDLLKNGFSVTLNDDEADVFVVNSCTVTAESDRKTRQTVRHLKRNHPDSIVVLTGCMPQAFPADGKRAYGGGCCNREIRIIFLWLQSSKDL